MAHINEHLESLKRSLNLTTPKDSDASPALYTCATCGAGFDKITSGKLLCPACNEGSSAHFLKQRWLALCPPLFADTAFDKLPDQLAAKRVVEWEYNPRGLVLYGPSRRGKSRSAWLLMRKLVMAGKTIGILNSSAGLTYASKYSESAQVVEGWLKELEVSDVLFMDDPFKIKLTDSFESVIFTLIDRRSEAKRPVIITANDTGETLKARMTRDRSEPLLARLREFCDPIAFN